MQLDPPDDSDDSLDVDKKKDETANSQDPVENILSNCILRKFLIFINISQFVDAYL